MQSGTAIPSYYKKKIVAMARQLINMKLKLMIDAKDIQNAENKIIKLLESDTTIIENKIIRFRKIGYCKTCGIELSMKTKNNAKFCSDRCRSEFNNERYRKKRILKKILLEGNK